MLSLMYTKFVYIKNFKNSKVIESPKHKKYNQIWTKITSRKLPVGVPWRRIYVPMEGDRRRNIFEYFFFSVAALKWVLEEYRNVGE